MIVDFGSTNLTSSGSAQKINDVDRQLTFISVQAKPGNTGDLHIGVSDVSATNGWTLKPGEAKDIDFDPQGIGIAINMNLLFFDGGTNNDDIEWMVFYKQ